MKYRRDGVVYGVWGMGGIGGMGGMGCGERGIVMGDIQ